ncbi:MAG: hypothetical protein WDW38_008024 [Sanguina aurantia]
MRNLWGKKRVPDLIVATPRRLYQIMKQDHKPSEAALMVLFKHVKLLIFYGTSMMFEKRLRCYIYEIVPLLPTRASRQTHVFTTDINVDVSQLVNIVLRTGHNFVNCVDDVIDVPQLVQLNYFAAPRQQLEERLLHILARCMRAGPCKAVVFLSSVAMCSLHASLYTDVMGSLSLGVEVLLFKPRMSVRDKEALMRRFESASRCIAFATDITPSGGVWRNVDVSLLHGAAPDKGATMSRVRRCEGRDGDTCPATFMVADFEVHCLDWASDWGGGRLSMSEIADDEEGQDIGEAHLGFLSSYNHHPCFVKFRHGGALRYSEDRALDKADVVAAASEYSRFLGLPAPPNLTAMQVQKLKYEDVPGIGLSEYPAAVPRVSNKPAAAPVSLSKNAAYAHNKMVKEKKAVRRENQLSKLPAAQQYND